MVFSRRIRAATKPARGEAQTHQSLRKLGKAPGICMAMNSNAQLRVQISKKGLPSKMPFEESMSELAILQQVILGITLLDSDAVSKMATSCVRCGASFPAIPALRCGTN